MQCGAFDGRPGSGACPAYESPAWDPGGDSSSPPRARTPSSVSALALQAIAEEPADRRASWPQS